MTQKLSPDQVSALSVVVGYCAPELYHMLLCFEPSTMIHKAAREVLDLAGLTVAQFIDESAERLARRVQC